MRRLCSLVIWAAVLVSGCLLPSSAVGEVSFGGEPPELPPVPGSCVCRCSGDDPLGRGCLPAWYLTGELCVGTCQDPGEQTWICTDGAAPADCTRIADAPYLDSGFYCCGCTS